MPDVGCGMGEPMARYLIERGLAWVLSLAAGAGLRFVIIGASALAQRRSHRSEAFGCAVTNFALRGSRATRSSCW